MAAAGGHDALTPLERKGSARMRMAALGTTFALLFVRCKRRSHYRRLAMNAMDRKPLFTFVSLLLGVLLFAPALHAQAGAASAAPRANALRREAAPASAQPIVDLNSAGLSELTKLPGVGPSRAQAILDLRAKLGGFKKVDDVMRVKGIGRKTFRKLEPMLRVGPLAPHAPPLPPK